MILESVVLCSCSIISAPDFSLAPTSSVPSATDQFLAEESQGMVMCASSDDAVEPLAPPPGSKAGDVIEFEGFEREYFLGFLVYKRL